MKFRKTISAIAALAMSVSCLAGLTITANATDGATVINYIGSESAAETFDSYTAYNGSVDADNDNAPRATFTTALSNVASGNNQGIGIFSVDYVAPPEVGSAYTETYPTYVNGNSLAVKSRGGAKTEGLNFSDSLTKGNIYFDSDVAIWGSHNALGGKLTFADSDGADVLVINLTNNRDPIKLNATGTEKKETAGKYTSRARKEGMGLHVSATIDLDAHSASVTFDYIQSDATTANTRVQETLTVPISATTDIKSFKITDYSGSSQNNAILIDNTKLYAKVTLPNTPYTVKYMTDASNDETVVKTDSSRKGFAGEAPVFSTATFEVEKESGVDRYFYVSDDSEGKTIAVDGSTVVKVLVRHGDNVNYTVNAVKSDDSVVKALTSGTAQEGDKLSYYFPQYILTEDKTLYSTTKKSSNPYYGNSVDVARAAITEKVTYTPVDGTGYVFYSEFEDLNGFSKITSNAADVRCSMGGGGNPTDASKGLKITTLEPGKYIIKSQVWGTAGMTVTFGVNGNAFEYTTGGDKIGPMESTGTLDEYSTGEVVIKTTCDLTVDFAGYNQNRTADYVLVQKTGDVERDVTIDAKKAKIAATDATTGMVGAPTFESVKENYDFENKKIVSVTVAAPTAEDKATVPVVTIGGTEYKFTAEEWTTISDADGLSYYMEFVKREGDDWKTFGDVTVTFGTGETAATKTIDLTA